MLKAPVGINGSPGRPGARVTQFWGEEERPCLETRQFIRTLYQQPYLYALFMHMGPTPLIYTLLTR